MYLYPISSSESVNLDRIDKISRLGSNIFFTAGIRIVAEKHFIDEANAIEEFEQCLHFKTSSDDVKNALQGIRQAIIL